MAYSEVLAQRLRQLLKRKADVSERKMFGGLAFLHRGNMCCGVIGNDLVVRVGVERGKKLGLWPHARPMDFTGRPMKGYLYVGSKGTASDDDLRAWLKAALSFTASLPLKVKTRMA